MTDRAQPIAQPLAQPVPAPAARGVVIVGYAAFLLLGWTSLLIPSLIRDVQAAYGQSDAGMGLAYFLNALLYVTGTLSIGVLAGRVPRRALLAGGPGLVGVGIAAVAIAPSWSVFLLAFLTTGLGLGIIDAGTNALFMDLFAGRAGMLNRLHLFYSLGALGAPLAVGLAISAGAPWQAVLLGTAAVAVPIALVLAGRRLPPTHPHQPQPVVTAGTDAATPVAAVAARPGGRRVGLPLLLLSLAIGCYVAAELGISSWLVRYLAAVPIAIATLALSLFWGAMGLSRFVSSFIADRMGAVVFATTWACICGGAILVALATAPVLPLAIACFAIAGFAAGPIYPSIMAIGGALHPGRASMVGSVLASAGMAGSIVYPPLMGVISEAVGLWIGIAGAGLFAIATGALIYTASRVAGGREAGLA